nr:DUF3265 domain-containing protein [Vibrio gangliei]
MLTICLRVIQHALHFYYELVLVIKAVCGSPHGACYTQSDRIVSL